MGICKAIRSEGYWARVGRGGRGAYEGEDLEDTPEGEEDAPDHGSGWCGFLTV